MKNETRIRSISLIALLWVTSISMVSYGQSGLIWSTPSTLNDTIYACSGQTIYLTTPLDTNIYQLTWSFPASAQVSTPSPGIYDVIFANAGDVQITLTATDSISTVYDTVVVHIEEVKSVALGTSAVTLCEFGTPLLLNSATPSGGEYFGPGVYNNTFYPDSVGPGVYQVCYSLGNLFYCSDTVCTTITVSPGADAAIADQNIHSPFSGCFSPGSNFQYTLFLSNVSRTASLNTSYYIDWGDGTNPYQDSVLPNGTSHTYFSQGKFNITVVVEAGSRCPDTAFYEFYNGKNPTVGIGMGASQGCAPLGLFIPILNTSSNPMGTRYVVSFGDGDTSYFNHPPPDTVYHQYLDASCGKVSSGGHQNAHSVEIWAINPCGITSASAGPIEVSEVPSPTAKSSDSIFCVGDTILLTDMYSGGNYIVNGSCYPGISANWTSTSASGLQFFNVGSHEYVTFTAPGHFEACQRIIHPCFQDSGCRDFYIADNLSVDLVGVFADRCVPAIVQFQNTSWLDSTYSPVQFGYQISGPSGGSNVLFGGRTDVNDIDLEFVLPGRYSVGFFAKNYCDSVYVDTSFLIGSAPQIDVLIDTIQYCVGDTFHYPAAALEIDSFSLSLLHSGLSVTPSSGWTWVQGSTNQSLSPTLYFSSPGLYRFQWEVETECGVDTNIQWIEIFPQSSFSTLYQQDVCHGSSGSILLDSSGFSNGSTVSWTCSNSTSFVFDSEGLFYFQIQDTTTFYAHVTDVNGCVRRDSVTIHVLPEIQMNLPANLQACPGDSVQMFCTITGGVGGYSFDWSPGVFFRDSLIQNPMVAGVDKPTWWFVRVTDSMGCSATDSVLVRPIEPLQPVDAGRDTTYCFANYREPLLGSVHGAEWIGPGVDSNHFNPYIAGLGEHRVYMSYTDSSGCTFTDSLTITVNDLDYLQLGADTAVCQFSSPIHLFALPEGGVWSINGPDSLLTGSIFNPSVSGVFELNYIVGSGSCEQSKAMIISVEPAPEIIAPLSLTVCSGDSTGVEILSSIASASIRWELIDSSQVSHLSQSGGNHIGEVYYSSASTIDTVTYRIWSTLNQGCNSDTVHLEVYVHPLPDFSLGIDTVSVCPGDSTIIDATSNPRLQIAWYNQNGSLIGSASQLRYLPDSNEVLYVMATDTVTGCVDSTVVQIEIAPSPEAFFLIETVGYCDTVQLWLTDSSSLSSRRDWYVNGQWVDSAVISNRLISMGQGEKDSTLTIKMVVESALGCKDSLEKSITISAPPKAEFYSAGACFGDSLILKDLSLSGRGIASWIWDFGDGTTDTLREPIHYYSAPGQYFVQLTVEDSLGCVHTSVDSVEIHGSSNSYFGIQGGCWTDTVCLGQPITFGDSVVIAGYQHYWDVGLNGVHESLQPTLIHTFSDTGYAWVQHVVQNVHGCLDSTLRRIWVAPSVEASFNVDTSVGCGPLKISVINLSNGLVQHSLWSIVERLPDSTEIVIYSSTQSQPQLPDLSASSGLTRKYRIQLIVSNCCGSDTAYRDIEVIGRPIAGAIVNTLSGCSPLNVDFMLEGQMQGSIDFVICDFGDGTLDTVFQQNRVVNGKLIPVWPMLTHTYNYNGNQIDTSFSPLLIAVGPCGVDSTSSEIVVGQSAVQAFIDSGPSTGCAPFEVSLSHSSFNTSQIWWCTNYSADSCSTLVAGDSLTWLYSSPGNYTVALFATDGCGWDTAFVNIQVFASPVASFSTARHCLGDTVDFINTTDEAGVGPNFYLWDFGDGSVSSLKNPSHFYSTHGTYTVKLFTQNMMGCADSSEQVIVVHPGIVVEFDSIVTCFNQQPIQFFNASDSSLQNSGVFIWNYGDGQTDTGYSPIHAYSQPGTYTVELSFQSLDSCIYSVQHICTILEKPDATILPTSHDSLFCLGSLPIVLNSIGFNPLSVWTVRFPDGRTIRDTATSFELNLSLEGSYRVIHFLINPSGCRDTAIRFFRVLPEPKARMQSDENINCTAFNAKFYDRSTTHWPTERIEMRYWKFGNHPWINTEDSVIRFPFNQPGTYDVRLAILTSSGCMDTAVYKDYIQVMEEVEADFEYEILSNGNFKFTNRSEGVDSLSTFEWDFGDGRRSSETSPEHDFAINRYQTDHTLTVCLSVDNGSGCIDNKCVQIDLAAYILEVPNAFTPDLKNVGEAAIFRPIGNSLIEYKLSVYDSNGNLVFESRELNSEGSPAQSWDGTLMGEGSSSLPSGIYIWHIYAVFENGMIWPGIQASDSKFYRHGTVTLLR